MSGIRYAAYLVTMVAAATGILSLVLITVWRRADIVGRVAVIVGAVSSTFGLTLRWIVVGHPPIFGTFENTYAAAWALLSAAALAGAVSSRYAGVWRWASPWALALMLYGTRFRMEPLPLTISERAVWVEVHVLFAWIAFVCLLGATTASIVRIAGREPLGLDGDEADRLVSRLLYIGFASFTVMLALGSWYLYLLFGEFWRWEIVETLSLVAWLGYGVVIHGRLFMGWGGRKFAVSLLSLGPVLLLAYFVWSVYPNTFHFFDIPLMRPY